MEKLIRLKVHRFLDSGAIFISDQVGIGKPNPKLYLRAARKVGVTPAEAMYVGDHPVNDMDAAKQAGFTTVWNLREGKHLGLEGATRPDYRIANFWDLLDILKQDFGLRVREGT
jgi:putative hydrolase of the HAD superfamily